MEASVFLFDTNDAFKTSALILKFDVVEEFAEVEKLIQEFYGSASLEDVTLFENSIRFPSMYKFEQFITYILRKYHVDIHISNLVLEDVWGTKPNFIITYSCDARFNNTGW